MRILLVLFFLVSAFTMFSQVKIVEGEKSDFVYKCGRDTIVLHADGGANYNWYILGVPFPVKQNVDSIEVGQYYATVPQRTVTYILEGDYGGGKDYDTLQVSHWRDKPGIELDIKDSVRCFDTSRVTVTDISSAFGSFSYQWKTETGADIAWETSNYISVNTGGVYILEKTIIPTDCFSTDTFTYIMHANPTLSLESIADICGEAEVTLNYNMTPDVETQEVTWSSSLSIYGADSRTPYFEYNGINQVETMIVGTISDTSTGCLGNSDTIYFKGDPQPVAGFNIGADSLFFCDTDSVEILSTTYDLSNFSYTWRDHLGDSIYSGQGFFVDSNAMFELTVDGLGSNCSSKEEVTIFLSTSPNALAIMSSLDSIRNNEVLSLGLSGNFENGTTKWYTTGDELLFNTEILDSVVYDSQQGDEGIVTFSVSVRNDCGVDSVSKGIYFIQTIIPPDYIVYVPNSFQPANANDDVSLFKVFGENISEDGFELMVFDKWGQVIFESSSFEEMNHTGWDGSDFPADVYTFFLKASFLNGDPIEEEGTLTLVR